MTYGGNFRRLAARFKEGRDFQIVARQGTSHTLILAIHGGRIEPGTADLATRVAGEDHALYLFKGIRPEGNAALHLTSIRFDEPRVLGLTAVAWKILSIHGCRGKAAFAVVGGRDREAMGRLRDALQGMDITVEAAAREAMAGQHPTNICNRGLLKKGIQLELSAGLRDRLLDTRTDSNTPGAELEHFCTTIREAIA